jgi:phosphatidylserine decarboxylase
VDKYGINISKFKKKVHEYESFHDFFVREYNEIEFPAEENILGSPCDARLSVYSIKNKMSALSVKGCELSLNKFINQEYLEEEFEGGHALVFRLCPLDYHRYHFPDSGKCTKPIRKIGKLHSVNPVAAKKYSNLFLQNERMITEFQSDHFGKIYYIEVGALCVGKICQTFDENEKVERGQEKGFFTFGASTVVLILEKKIKIDSDLIENTEKNFETLIKVGEAIAKV